MVSNAVGEYAAHTMKLTPESPEVGDREPTTESEQPSTISGSVLATILVVVVLTVIGLVLGYLAALLVVKVGLPTPKLVVGLPLVAVLGLAWALSTQRRLRDVLVTVACAATLSVGLFVLVDPDHPSHLFEKKSELVDVDVDLRQDTADLTVKTWQEMNEMPAFTTLLGLSSLLASLAVLLCGVARPVYEHHQARKRDRGF
jgi:uncharacterized membrane protein YkgB